MGVIKYAKAVRQGRGERELMMRRAIRRWGFAGLVLCCGTVNGFAGDSVNYRFGDWTVTVSPRHSDLASMKKTNATVEQAVVQPDRKNNQTGLIRQVSSTQEIPAPVPSVEAVTIQPTPTPIADVPAPSPSTNNTITFPERSSLPTANGYASDLPIIRPRPNIETLNRTPVIPQTAQYRDIYFSIPFNRSEYNHYPNYRHDATMELLFNQMRPTIMQRTTTTVGDPGGNYSTGYGYPYNYPPYPFYPFGYGVILHRAP